MSNLNLRLTKEIFARLFVAATNSKMNLFSFTYYLERSKVVSVIEEKSNDELFNKSLTDIFVSVTGHDIENDNSYGVYNDAYWCGSSYFELFLRTGKPFSYLFLKLPLVKMMDIYPIYHEMDISSLVMFFNNLEKEKTILRLLCKNNRCSLPKLSSATGISLSTLSKYNANDAALYKGSFQNIIKIAKFFDAPISLFIERLETN